MQEMNDLDDAIIWEEDIDAINKILKEHPQCLCETNDSGRTPLHQALLYGKHKVVSLLLSCGAAVNIPDKQGYTPLHEAVSGSDIQKTSVDALIRAGADVNAKAEQEYEGYEITPLELLATAKMIDPKNLTIDDVAELLIKSGARFYKVAVAAVFGTLKDVEDLINNKANIDDFLNNVQLRGLHIAAKLSNIALAQLLIDNGADVNSIESYSYKTPLDYASSIELAELLRLHGAKKHDEILDEISESVEHVHRFQNGFYYGEELLNAAKIGDLKKVIEILTLPVERGGLLFLRLAARNKEGKTALHLAAENGHKAIVEFLLSQGMRINIEALSDVTSEDIRKFIQDYESLKSGA